MNLMMKFLKDSIGYFESRWPQTENVILRAALLEESHGLNEFLRLLGSE